MQGSYNTNFSAGGFAIAGSSTPTADTPNPYQVPVPAALAGVLSTRTDANTGVITVASGHGITTSDTVDLYDAAGLLMRKDVDVTAVTGTTISIDLGTGVSPYTDLPVVTTVVNVAKQVVLNVWIKEDSIVIWGVSLDVPGASTQGRVLFEDGGGSDVLDTVLTANKGLIQDVANGAANSLANAGDPIVKCSVTSGNTLVAGVLTIISMEDRTP